MFGFTNKVSDIGDIENLFKNYGAARAGEIIRDLAMNKNLLCQIFLSGAGLQVPEENRTSKISQDIELFTKLAAEGGDPGSQFNLALIYTQKVDSSNKTFSKQDIELLHKAKLWHEKAVAQGFTPSIQSLKNIKTALGEK